MKKIHKKIIRLQAAAVQKAIEFKRRRHSKAMWHGGDENAKRPRYRRPSGTRMWIPGSTPTYAASQFRWWHSAMDAGLSGSVHLRARMFRYGYYEMRETMTDCLSCPDDGRKPVFFKTHSAIDLVFFSDAKDAMAFAAGSTIPQDVYDGRNENLLEAIK